MNKSKVRMPKELEKNAILQYIQRQQLLRQPVQYRYQCRMRYQLRRLKLR